MISTSFPLGKAWLGLRAWLGSFLFSQPFPQCSAASEVSHQEKYAYDGNDQRDKIYNAGEGVIQSVQRGGNEQCQRVQRLAVSWIQSRHTDEISSDATPYGVKERQRGEPGYVQDERRRIVGLDVDRRLVLHALENAECNSCDKTVEDHRLWQHGLPGVVLQDKERHLLGELLRYAYSQYKADDAQRELGMCEGIKEIQGVESGEYHEDTDLRKEECRYGGLELYLPGTEHIIEEHSPDGGEIQRYDIEDEVSADRHHHDERQRETHYGEYQQPLVLKEVMAFHVIPGIDEFLADIVELLAQRAVVANARPEATCQQEVFHYSLPACLGIACLVVHQQPPFLYILSHNGLVEWSVIVFVSCNYYHRLFTLALLANSLFDGIDDKPCVIITHQRT